MTAESPSPHGLSANRQWLHAALIGVLAYAAIVGMLCGIRPGNFGAAVSAFASSLGRIDGLFLALMLLFELSAVAYDLIGWQQYASGRSTYLRQLSVYPGGDGSPLASEPLGPLAKAFLYVVFAIFISTLAYFQAFTPLETA